VILSELSLVHIKKEKRKKRCFEMGDKNPKKLLKKKKVNKESVQPEIAVETAVVKKTKKK
jgi:hypothetical protein